MHEYQRDFQRDIALSKIDRAREHLEQMLADIHACAPPYPDPGEPMAAVTREGLKEVLDLLTKARDHIMEI
ncbi:MAG: hypothetical protein ABSA46_10200 [Thermodesulfovibrionales bacterium]|jgi:hypothetical protein